MTTMASQYDIVMTRPSAFEVDYVINPWMQPKRWRQSPESLQSKAQMAWQSLYDGLAAAGVRIHLLDPVTGLPDLVFPANAAVVLDGKVLLGRFANAERQQEEPVYRSFFNQLQQQGVIESVAQIPQGQFQEGAGDCLWDGKRNLFWAGYGQRSSLTAAAEIAEFFNCETQPLELVDPRYYHLDVAFAVLEHGEVLYYPPAFSDQSLAIIRERIPSAFRIEVGEADAVRFNLNIVSLNGCLFLTPLARSLKNQLQERGYRLFEIGFLPFMLAGGAAACLTLRLDLHSRLDSNTSSSKVRHATNH